MLNKRSLLGLSVAVAIAAAFGPVVASAAHVTDGAPNPACSAPTIANGGEIPNGITITPQSGPPTQVISMHLSSALLASRQWGGFYILWDQSQPIEDGGGGPPQDLTFTPPDFNTTGTTQYMSPGYHTVGVYDTYNNVGTMEPKTDVASASFYIYASPEVCPTPTTAPVAIPTTAPSATPTTVPVATASVASGAALSIDQLHLPAQVRGGQWISMTLVTATQARVRVSVHVPATRGAQSYDLSVESPTDSMSGALSLNIQLPVKPRHTVQAAVKIVVHAGPQHVQKVAHVTVTP